MSRPTQRDPASLLGAAMLAMRSGRQPEQAIYDQEATGAAEMADPRCEVIPIKLLGCTEDDLLVLGFELDAVDSDDPLFRDATLPAGWSRHRTGHDMWTVLVDQDGHRRAAIFYKASWHDRKAFMRLTATDESDEQ